MKCTNTKAACFHLIAVLLHCQTYWNWKATWNKSRKEAQSITAAFIRSEKKGGRYLQQMCSFTVLCSENHIVDWHAVKVRSKMRQDWQTHKTKIERQYGTERVKTYKSGWGDLPTEPRLDKLLTDDRNRKSILMNTSAQRSKRRSTSGFLGCVKVTNYIKKTELSVKYIFKQKSHFSCSD